MQRLLRTAVYLLTLAALIYVMLAPHPKGH